MQTWNRALCNRDGVAQTTMIHYVIITSVVFARVLRVLYPVCLCNAVKRKEAANSRRNAEGQGGGKLEESSEEDDEQEEEEEEKDNRELEMKYRNVYERSNGASDDDDDDNDSEDEEQSINDDSDEKHLYVIYSY